MGWKKFAESFITFEEKVPQKTDALKPIKDQLSNPDNTAVKSYQTYDSSVTPGINVFTPGTTLNPEIKTHLLNLIKENNLDGLDYCEYSVQLEISKSWPIPIEQKYQAAFAAVKGQAELSKQEFNKEKLVSSANFYKTVIQKEITSFETEFASTYKEQVEDNKSLVQVKAKQMQNLSEQLNALNKEIQDLNIKISQSDSQLKMNKDMFISTGNVVLTEIDSEIEKINLYIS